MNTEELIPAVKAPQLDLPVMDKKEGFLKELLERVLNSKEQERKPSKKKWAPPSDYSYFKQFYAGSGDKLQHSNMSRKERFPILFDRAKELQPGANRILSFGCSVGYEVEALSKRFPDAEIVGVDIDHHAIQTARRTIKGQNIWFVDELGPCGQFQLITCFQVLFCLEIELPKNRWLKAMEKIDRHTAPGGLVMIYTSDFDPAEVLTADKYEPVNVWLRKHNKKPNGKDYFNGYYRRKITNV